MAEAEYVPEDVPDHVDVLVVGAGISGIGAGWHLQKLCPGKTYAILEGREAIGGTWDLFRYPGVRSDSDMYTLGYRFKPWTEAKAIADGPSILKYVRETARENGIDRHIRFQHLVKRASWSSAEALWTVEAEVGPEKAVRRFTCGFLFMCSGYYDYSGGHAPEFEGAADFAGEIVHPQHWPEALDYTGKRVVVIGSGATAVTLVPAMADKAAHVTMLQRSPTYVVSRPAEDAMANRLRELLPAKLAYRLIRWRNVLFGMFFYSQTRKKPELTKERLLGMVRQELGPDYDVATHFTPRYNPWDQRLCLVPDSDLFRALKSGQASVVTDHIERFTETGIRLKSGQELPADVVVTATGLKLVVLSGMEVMVDGRRVAFGQTTSYKGMMYAGTPNLASSFGYVNASWTLKADLTCEYVCRLLNHMDRKGVTVATPSEPGPEVAREPWMTFSSGYVTRAMEAFPKQATIKPWKLHQNYAKDVMELRFGRVDDGVLKFSNATGVVAPARMTKSREPVAA